jgi:hypothetical protein
MVPGYDVAGKSYLEVLAEQKLEPKSRLELDMSFTTRESTLALLVLSTRLGGCSKNPAPRSRGRSIRAGLTICYGGPPVSLFPSRPAK